MVRLRIALGVASSLVAVAALTIVFAGTGQAQGNGNGQNPQNVNIVNTPLPVIGNVTATMSGNVSANIINPVNNPVLIRDVDAQGAKTLWQEQTHFTIQPGDSSGVFDFPFGAPVGKALVVENMHLVYDSNNPTDLEPPFQLLVYTQPFGASESFASQQFVPQPVGDRFVADSATKFYIAPGYSVHLVAERALGASNGSHVILDLRLTGYLVDYP
jgi:hypothetical protein